MIRRIIIVAVFGLIVFNSSAQGWVLPVPEEKSLMTAPAMFTETDKTEGAALYQKFTCFACHGMPGKGNFQATMNPTPGDFASEKYQSNTDGDFLYKIMEGKGTMPSFKTQMSKEEIWKIISYIRSFNPKYVQVIRESKNAEISGKVYAKFTFSEKKQNVKAIITSDKANKQPIAGAKISLFAKRYYGWLLLDEARTTDANGVVKFKYPADLPGDQKGLVTLKITTPDADEIQQTIIDTTVVTTHLSAHVDLNEQKAMWNTNAKAPNWIKFSYIGVVLIVWSVIFYIISQLLKIMKANKTKEEA